MSTVEGKKQEKRRALLDAAYELFLERGAAKTSVEDITSRAKVGKGTFYLYFQDKGAVMQALLGRVSYQLLSDACLAVEQHPELPDFTAQVVFVIDHIIEALRQDALVLRFLERNFVWPGLDQIEASREAEPLMRAALPRTERKTRRIHQLYGHDDRRPMCTVQVIARILDRKSTRLNSSHSSVSRMPSSA